MPKTWLFEFSTLQINLATSCFPDGQGMVDVAAFDGALEAFAAGELRVSDTECRGWNCEPDSALFFCFAEFALHAIEVDVDKDIWQSLAPSLLRTQEVYSSAYAPRTLEGEVKPWQERTFGDYGLEHRGGTVSRRFRRQLINDYRRDRVDANNLSALHIRAGRNAYRAFPRSGAERAEGP